jgi:hypothetical protein
VITEKASVYAGAKPQKFHRLINLKEEYKMNHKLILIRLIALIVVMVLVTGCATPTATPCPTNEPQSCPTAAAKALPEVNTWRWSYTGGIPTNVIITFDPGDKCSMEVINPIATSYFNTLWNQVSYEIVVNDQTYENYVVFVYSVDPGTTQEQMDAPGPDPSLGEPPSWVNIITGDVIYPMTRTFHTSAIDITEGPLYFTCLAQGPDKLKIIGGLGPLEVPAH